MTDNASNSFVCVQDQVFVSSETCYLRRVDPNTLDTKEKVDLNKLMSVNFASSHPMTDSTGTTYNLGCSFLSGPKYNIVRIPPSKDSNLSGTWDSLSTWACKR
ncbi:beta,beta-carotene 9',10'-oxygenase-like [Homarus americanus]|uniref:beta,beta-carotene 9',10'-oxygenase-like n=1 Tax=Homarus americanus TaxID=6706 RepID=UPI001C43FD4A|nr:beta,beta-carotene 9',10'-oxygenase-like [Homarus americanus]